MAKNGLFSKVFGKQESSCCSMSFEEVPEEGTSEEDASEEQQNGRETNAGSEAKAKARADERRDSATRG